MSKKYMLYKGDCLEEMKKIPSGKIDLVCTDPPYKKVAGGCTNKAVRLSGASQEDLSKGKFFKENIVKFEEWIPECYRVLKEGTHCYIMSDDRNLKDILNTGEKTGFKLLNILTWKKTKHTPNRYYLKNSEFIVMFRKGKARNINHMGTYQVLEFPNVEKKTHPAEKPFDLIKCLVENSTNENDIVLDPFMGSGVCGDVCVKTGRKFVGIEKDENYFNIAKGRIEGV